jgi:RimJ/RimL family protein N-acetyltransferase
MAGRYSRVEPLDADRHAAELHTANLVDEQGANWTYLPYGPFTDLSSYRAWIAKTATGSDPMFWSVVDLATERAVGVATYMRIKPATGSVEVGHINYSPLLQRTRAGTEAMYLMMRRVFEDWGYRRYEWKCNDLNTASKAAAARLGFRYEGTFRNHLVVKGRNRDTAWFSVIDSEWPSIKGGFEGWLAPSNFDDAGGQLSPLRTRPR